jgi:acetyl-CoA synthetase
MLPPGETYEDIRAAFRWQIPERYNIGVDVCDKWADGSGRTALLVKRAEGGIDSLSFDWLKARSNRLANALRGLGVGRGDRVAVLLPQAPETALTHISAHKLGAISVPLFTLFGEDALAFRLADCGASALVTDAAGLAKIAGLRAELPDLKVVLSIDGRSEGAEGFEAVLEQASDRLDPVDTAAEDPAVIIYTSGTTGQPKGALHAHRVLLGHLPGVEMPQELFPKPGDLMWTPADWAWIGGLFDVLLPSLHHGVPVLAHRQPKFDPEEAFALMAQAGVRNTFVPPTALKIMRGVARPRDRWGYALRSVCSGGETLGAELLDWGQETFGLTINEFYGQTECNVVVANSSGILPVRPGSMGRAAPGHRVAIVDADGQPLPAGEAGTIAIRHPDPVMFLGYWNKPTATAEKFAGDWLLTGDQGLQDDEGYFRFVGRDDDVITSGGYRIGPGEIEDCLLKHPAVALAAAVGVPDPLRTERVKAFIVPAEGVETGPALVEEIQNFVKTRLAAHEYPREVEFVSSLPMTTTGKIVRRELRARG